MLEVSEYLTYSRDQRRSHLNLSEDCSEIGGNSQEFRALLSYFVGVKIPQKREFYLCHACNNDKCSNVHHLYWGTPKDNVQDMKERGTWKNVSESTKKKYGGRYKEIISNAGRAGGKAAREKPQSSHEEIIKRLETLDFQNSKWTPRASAIIGVNPASVRRWMRREIPEFYKQNCSFGSHKQ